MITANKMKHRRWDYRLSSTSQQTISQLSLWPMPDSLVGSRVPSIILQNSSCGVCSSLWPMSPPLYDCVRMISSPHHPSARLTPLDCPRTAVLAVSEQGPHE